MHRRCPHHPQVIISSPCGNFDAPCEQCEYAAEYDAAPPEKEPEEEPPPGYSHPRYGDW